MDSIINSAFDGLKLQNIDNQEQVADLLDRFDLRWSVSKQPLFLPNGEETPYLAVVRDDNNAVFTTCKEGYVPYQNSELAELLVRVSEKTGYGIHSGGMFNGGGKVFIQLSTGNEIKDIGNNRSSVKGYISGINGHDGTTSLKWGSVNFTICCRNTFAMAGRSLQNTARHTSAIHERVEMSLREISAVTKQEQSIFDSFIKMSEIPVRASDIKAVVKSITTVDIDMSKSRAEEIYSSYSINRSGELLSSISRELAQKGETLWGLFSGVTHYTSHVMPTPKRDNARTESKYVGGGATIDNNAYDSIMKLAHL